MKLSRTTILMSFLISTISFLAYISQCPSILLSAQQANEALLSIFGAGISSLFVGILEYRSERTKLEQRIITQVEPILSSIASLQAITVENYTGIADHKHAVDFLVQQLESESPIQLLSIKAQGDSQTNGQLSSRSSITNNQRSSSSRDDHLNRYIQRHKEYISEAARDYARTADRLKDSAPSLRVTISEISYLSTALHIPWGREVEKYKSLCEMDDIVNSLRSELEDTFGVCRLFIVGQSSHSDTLQALLVAQSLLERPGKLEPPSDSKATTNWYASSLYKELRKYAKLIKYGNIPERWW